MAKSVLVLLALAVVLALVSIEAEAFLQHLFGKNAGTKSEGPANKVGGNSHDNHEGGDHDDGGFEAAVASISMTAKMAPKARFAKRRVDSSATRATNRDNQEEEEENDDDGDDQQEPANGSKNPRRLPRARSQRANSGAVAHGRTRRNQLRKENKPVNSYLHEQAQRYADSDHEEEEDDDDDDQQHNSRTSRHRHAPTLYKHKTATLESLDEEMEVDDDEEEDELLDDDDDDDDDGDGDGSNSMNSNGRSRATHKDKQLKYVATEPKGKTKDGESHKELLSKIKIRTIPKPQTNGGHQEQTGDEESSGSGSSGQCSTRGDGKKGCVLTSKQFWNKQWKGVKKVTNKSVETAKKTLNDIPAGFEKLVDTVNTAWELDSRGKILALQREVSKAARFVRSEFAKFTVDWSRIMEQALDYLGDKNLDKITWNDEDELDFRRDALHSLVIGYEFIRLMIIWRENLLLAHEGFKIWLDKLKLVCEKDKTLDINNDLEFPPKEVHNYMLLMAWDQVQFESLEPRLKLDHLMKVEDSRKKKYLSRFFRNIVVLQEIYFPTIEELDNERNSVKLPTYDQDETAEFFEEFRNDVAARKVDDIDVLAPNELVEFVTKLTPQLQFNKLVYTKSYLKTLAAEMQEARQRREQELAESWEGDEDSEDDEDDY